MMYLEMFIVEDLKVDCTNHHNIAGVVNQEHLYRVVVVVVVVVGLALL